MLSSLRILAWRVLEQGRQVLLKQRLARGGIYLLPPFVHSGQAGLYRYLQHHALTKLGPGGVGSSQGRGSGLPVGSHNNGPGGPVGSSGVVRANTVPLVTGLLGRLGPLVSGALRRLSSGRGVGIGGYYRHTAPLFALVGVTLRGVGDEEENERVRGGTHPGFVTKQEELEAVCCGIREAVTRAGWLFEQGCQDKEQGQAQGQQGQEHGQHVQGERQQNLEQNQTSNANQPHSDATTRPDQIQQETEQGTDKPSSHAGSHQFSLADLELAGVIDQGCNAVVYAARWRGQGLQDTVSCSMAPAEDLNNVEHAELHGAQCVDHHGAQHKETHGGSDHEICVAESMELDNINDNSSSSTDTLMYQSCETIQHQVEPTVDNSILANQNINDDSNSSFSSTSNSSININSEFLSNLNLNTSFYQSQEMGSIGSLPSHRRGHKLFAANNDQHNYAGATEHGSSASLKLYNTRENGSTVSLNPLSSTVSLSPLPSTVSLGQLPATTGFGEISCSFSSTALLEEEELGQPQYLSAPLYDDDARLSMSVLSEDVSLLLSSGGFGPPSPHHPRKRVRFSTCSNIGATSGANLNTGATSGANLNTEATSGVNTNTTRNSNNEATGNVNIYNREENGNSEVNNMNGRGACGAVTRKNNAQASTSAQSTSKRYTLAVKLVFNYEAASNAPAVLSALYREMVPARSVQLDDLYKAWREDFFSGSTHTLLPAHPNVVDMPCVFVDRVPLLPEAMERYPTALPSRLNPHGFGRNMSLFCVMKRYDMSLDAYLLRYPSLPPRTSLLLFTQLLEALLHLNTNHISHRDLKLDNILISLPRSGTRSVTGNRTGTGTGNRDGGDNDCLYLEEEEEGWDSPWLVLTDFGCCLPGGSASGLSVHFMSRDADPRQGNAALMAPEVKTARPGLLKSIDFSRCDLWAAGALAYPLYGRPNPFLRHEGCGAALDSGGYREAAVPPLPAPPPLRRLVHDLLRRKPANRPSPAVAATLAQLSLWGPRAWLLRRPLARPSHDQIMEWLLCLTTKVLCERRGGFGGSGSGGGEVEFRLVSTFLARVHYTDVLAAIAWNRAF